MARVDDDASEGDTIYAVDRVSEELLLEFFEREIAPHAPLVLIAEGIAGGKTVLPRGAAETDAVWRVIVDPIDGTRGIMAGRQAAMLREHDAIVVGGNFAGLAVARRLRGRVLLVDRHDVGAVQTSACATPLWVPQALDQVLGQDPVPG